MDNPHEYGQGINKLCKNNQKNRQEYKNSPKTNKMNNIMSNKIDLFNEYDRKRVYILACHQLQQSLYWKNKQIL